MSLIDPSSKRSSNAIRNPFPEEAIARVEQQSAGSQFTINNTTYSGADIKVVVHMYDVGAEMKGRSADIQSEIKESEAEAKSLLGLIFKSRQDLANLKEGTREKTLLQRVLSQRITRRDNLLHSILALENKLNSLTKGTPKLSTKVLAEMQTLSISVFRDKQAVRSCGSVYPKGFTRGPREIAGTAIFTVFDRHVLDSFMDSHMNDFDHSSGPSAVLIDQLPPVDITVSFANEFGAISRMGIFGVEFVDEAQTMSIEDLITENTVSLVARGIDPMRSVGQRQIDESSIMLNQFAGKRASDLILEEDYQKIKNSMNPFERFRKQRNPYI